MPSYLFALKELLTGLALPPASPILLALFGVWLARWRPRLGRGISILALLGLYVLSLQLTANVLQRGLEIYPPVSPQDLARGQAIVILAGGAYSESPEYGAGTVNGVTLERVRYGAFLQQRSGLPILVTGGGPITDTRTESDAMKEVIERQFHGQVKWIENASLDTRGNAAFSALMLKKDNISRIVLVSHGWHLQRAVELFKRQGLEVIAAPVGSGSRFRLDLDDLFPSASALDQSSNSIHEWLGVLVMHFSAAKASPAISAQ